MAACLARQFSQLAGWLAGWLVGWSTGRLADEQTGWMAIARGGHNDNEMKFHTFAF
ncbi:unnamed protein product, partial [Ceratitis capitata]